MKCTCYNLNLELYWNLNSIELQFYRNYNYIELQIQ